MSDSIDNDIGPETGAVFTYTPALILELAYTRGDLKRSRRKPIVLIFLGIKSREVMTDDFSGGSGES